MSGRGAPSEPLRDSGHVRCSVRARTVYTLGTFVIMSRCLPSMGHTKQGSNRWMFQPYLDFFTTTSSGGVLQMGVQWGQQISLKTDVQGSGKGRREHSGGDVKTPR